MRREYIIGVITILLVILIILYFKFTKTRDEKFVNYNYIDFMSHENTRDFLLKDSDNYVKNFSDIDLYARKVKNYKEYIEKICDCTISFTESQKELLKKCINKADNFFNSYKGIINGNDISKIKWKLALTHRYNNFEYEEGLPHTRQDVIFITSSIIPVSDEFADDLINILIHEKIHIYQRYNKKEIDNKIKAEGYMILPESKINKDLLYLRRSNPDIDNTIYYNPVNNKEMIFYYRTDKPNNISDILTNDFSLEHPYEKMAYEIANYYSKKQLDKYINII